MRLAQENKTDSALAAFALCTDATPERVDAWLNMAKIYGQVGRSSEALSTLHKAEQLFPANSEVRQMVANMERGK